jgi:hypothetical protein
MGAGRRLVTVVAALALGIALVLSATAHARPLVKTATLTSSDSPSQLGQSVAVSGDGSTAIVGDPASSVADVFTRSPSGWSAGHALPSPVGNDQFGASVAISADGSTVIVGAPSGNSAYTFTQTNGAWSAANPLPGNPATGAFGTSVAISADGATALVGAPGTGNAYVFAAPAATISTVVQDAGTGQPWSGAETTGAFAADAATISGQGGDVPTGMVTYSLYDDGACSGTVTRTDAATVEADGSVRDSVPIGPLHAGAHAFRATYSGDTTYSAASGPCESFTVARANVTLSATSTPSTVSSGNTVIVSAAGLPGSATGTIAFTAANQTLCTTTVSAGAGSCTTPVLAPGVYPVTAAYSGDGDNLAGSATTSFTIAASPAPAAAYKFTFPPSITVAQPANGASYTRGETVRASYTCVDGTGAPGLSSCDGTVPRGALVDTSTAGPHGFTVTGMSRSGASTVRTIHYLVVLASNRIVVAAPQLRGNGGGTIDVTVPGPGVLTVVETAWSAHQREPRINRQAVVSRAAAAPSHSGTVTLRLLPAPAGRRLLRNSRGQRLRIRLAVTFAPTGGPPRQLTKYGLLRIG